MASCLPRGHDFSPARRRTVLSALTGLMSAGTILALSGCAAPPPPPPPPTIVYVQIVTTTDVNALPGAPGAPLAVRVYQLASSAGFLGAEFYPLYSADSVALGADRLKKDEMVMAPSATKTLMLTPSDQVKSIGVFAAYQTFQAVTWRAAADIPPNTTTTFTVTASATGLKLVATPGKPVSP